MTINKKNIIGLAAGTAIFTLATAGVAAAADTVIYQTQPGATVTTTQQSQPVVNPPVVNSTEEISGLNGQTAYSSSTTTSTTTSPQTTTTVVPNTTVVPGTTTVIQGQAYSTTSPATSTTTAQTNRMDPAQALDILKKQASMQNQNLQGAAGGGDNKGSSGIVTRNLSAAEEMIKSGRDEEARGYLKIAASQLGQGQIRDAL